MSDTKYIYIFLFTIFSFLGFFLLDASPTVMVDEFWYANTAWNHSIGNGFVNTVPGDSGGDDLFFFTFLISMAFSIFGESLTIARGVSFLGGIVGLIGFIKILKLAGVRHNHIIFISCLIFIFSNVNFIVFRTVRPESWIIALSVWALFFFLIGLKEDNKINFFLTGIFTSAIFLVHPHGALYVLIFGVSYIVHSLNLRNFNSTIIYFLGLIPIASILMIYIYVTREDTLINFFSSWLSRTTVSNNELSLLHLIKENIFDFVSKYTLGYKRAFILLCEIIIIVYGLSFYKKTKYIFVLSIIALSYLIIALLFLHPFNTRHFGEILVFSYLIFPLTLHYYLKSPRQYKVLIIIGYIYLFNNIAGDLYFISKNYEKTPYSFIEKKIDNLVPDQTKVLSLLNFWLPLRNNENYNEYTRWGKTDYKNLDELILSNDVKYIVISDYLTKGETTISGRVTSKNTKNQKSNYYEKVYKFAKQDGQLIEVIPTNGYGNIEIWYIE